MGTEALYTISSALLVEVGVALFHTRSLRKTCISLLMSYKAPSEPGKIPWTP